MKINVTNNKITGYCAILSEHPYKAVFCNFDKETAIDAEIESVDLIHIGFSTYSNGVFKENKSAYEKSLEPTAEETARKEMSEIKSWLSANDYKVNKFILGEYAEDDERWTSYLEEREQKLARYNELESRI